MDKIILNGNIVDNNVSHIADEDAVPTSGTISVSLERWIENREELIARGNCGVRLTGGDDFSQILPDLAKLPSIAIEFPAFTDGRGYSYATLLRTRHGYTGELRAIGDVGQDQLQPLQRCGFTAFELREGLDPTAAIDGFDDFSVRYQPSADVNLPLYRQIRR